MIPEVCMTLMLEKGVSGDPPRLPHSLFRSWYHASYPLFCLEIVFERVLVYGRTYCGIHLMIRGVCMTLIPQKGVSTDPWRSPHSLFSPMGIKSVKHSIFPFFLGFHYLFSSSWILRSAPGSNFFFVLKWLKGTYSNFEQMSSPACPLIFRHPLEPAPWL